MSNLATGVVVVTARVTDEDGVRDHAMTANTLTSVSLDPPMVLFCVQRTSRFHDAVLAAGAWAVNVLGEDLRSAAAWFATHGRPIGGQLGEYRYATGRRSGAPVLSDAIASLECRTWATYPGGDHTIVVGEVQCVRGPVGDDAEPLIYFRSRFRQLDA
jgi:flavin reductase (DIM6/NTAB) family NADH-FMN oxidoreductase RutF